MELHFAPNAMNYLCQLFRETRTQEETVDLIVPDSCPDVERILCGNAVAVTRSKECREGSVTVSGGIRANALYMAAGEESPRCIEAYLPFTAKADSPQLNEDAQVLFRANIRSVDVRMVNSRKLAMRVNLCWTMIAYGDCRQELYTLEEPPVTLQTHTVEYPMLLPVETAECSFQMSEELTLPGSKPLAGPVYHFSPRLELTEQRLAGNKAVFKGLVHLHVLYGTDENKLATFETELPFSQYCELRETYDEEDLHLQVGLTGCELDRTLQQNGEGLLATLHILVQCVVMQRKTVSLLDDAYCLDGELLPQWAECSFTNRLDCQQLSRTVRESKNAAVQDVVDVWVYPDHGQVTKTENGAEITLPATVTVLYIDHTGALQAMSFRSELKETMHLADNARCYVASELSGDVAAIPTGSGVELRYPAAITVETFADGTYRTLCGGEIRETEHEKRARPAVVVRRTRSGESLWEIAKSNCTTVEKICKANRMDSDVTEGGVLLIPT